MDQAKIFALVPSSTHQPPNLCAGACTWGSQSKLIPSYASTRRRYGVMAKLLIWSLMVKFGNAGVFAPKDSFVFQYVNTAKGNGRMLTLRGMILCHFFVPFGFRQSFPEHNKNSRNSLGFLIHSRRLPCFEGSGATPICNHEARYVEICVRFDRLLSHT